MAQHGNKEIVTVALEKSVHDRLVRLQLRLGYDRDKRISLSDSVDFLLEEFMRGQFIPGGDG